MASAADILNLLRAVYGSRLGGGSLSTLEQSREVTRESFLQPQPVGLTNTQCQILGPYFTRTPTHCHPEARRDSAKEHQILRSIFSIPGLDAATLSALPKFDVNRADVTYSEDELALAEENLMLMASCLTDGDLSSFHQVAMLTSRQDPTNEFMLNGLQGVKTVSLKIPRFGSRLARALSIACVGVDCYWNVFQAHLERLLQDRAAVAAMCDAVGLEEGSHVNQMLTYVRSGMELPLLQTQGLLFLAAQTVGRPVLLLPDATTDGSTVFAFLPSMVPPEGRSKAPVTLCRLGDEIDSVLIPTSSSPVWVSPRFEMVIYLPLALTGSEGEFCELQADPAHGTVLLNPAVVTREATEQHRIVSLPMVSDCARHQGPNPALLSFSSFPPTSFSLAGDEATANTLLQSRGYGRDHCGARDYLALALKNSKNLEIVHVDADGHCLAHSLSRCLVGKEYFWHALRTELYETMRQGKALFVEFLKRNAALAALEDEYDSIADRANPDREYPEGCVTPLATWRGLGTEHIFVLANILRRPILLLDGVTEHRESYFFLPLLHKAEECSTRKVLVVAWSSSSHGHYVPVVSVLRGVESSIDDSVLPRNSATQEYLVYGVPDGASANEYMSQYVEFRESPRRVIVGGECELDARPWCQAVVDTFETENKYSVWMIHEACRCLLSEKLMDSSTLACPRTLSNLEKLITVLVRDHGLRYCQTCTSTVRTSVCRCSMSQTVVINPKTGMIQFSDADRMPVESHPGFACCVFKHWVPYTDEPVSVGSLVYARDLSSTTQVATVVGIDVGKSTYDLAFDNGAAANIRFNCPASEVQLGVPCDCHSKKVRVGRGDVTFPINFRYDSDPRIRTDPIRDSRKATEQALRHPRFPREMRTPEGAAMFQKLIAEDLNSVKTWFEQQISKRRRSTARDASGGSSPPPATTEGSSPARKPIHTDEDNNPVLWESMDPRTREWFPYEHETSGLIEAAYRSGAPVHPVELPGLGVFTVRFRTMQQENALGYARPVRRRVMKEWDCQTCTFHNPGTRQLCEMCGTPMQAPTSSKTEGSSAVTSNDVDDDDDDDPEEIAEELAITERSDADPRLAGPDGHLYKIAAETAGDRAKTTLQLCFPADYGTDAGFIYDEQADRWRYLPYYIAPSNPVGRIVRADGLAGTAGGSKLYVYGGDAMYMERKNGALVRYR